MLEFITFLGVTTSWLMLLLRSVMKLLIFFVNILKQPCCICSVHNQIRNMLGLIALSIDTIILNLSWILTIVKLLLKDQSPKLISCVFPIHFSPFIYCLANLYCGCPINIPCILLYYIDKLLYR